MLLTVQPQTFHSLRSCSAITITSLALASFMYKLHYCLASYGWYAL